MTSRCVLLRAFLSGVVVVVVASCSEGDEDKAQRTTDRVIATVAGNDVPATRFRKWLGLFAGLPAGAEAKDAESYVRDCVRRRRRASPRPPRRDDPSSAQACRESLRLARETTLGFLIRTKWLRLEANRRELSVSKDAIDRQYASLRSTFPTRAAFRQYVQGSGMTPRQLRLRMWRDAIAKKLVRRIAKPDLTVGKAAARSFYRRNRSDFVRPHTRHLRVVATADRQQAERARIALVRGQLWSDVAGEFSSDDFSRRRGGRMAIDTTNVLTKLRMAAFEAPLGQLVGPLRVRSSWWVFQVVRDLPARQQPFGEIRSVADRLVRSSRVARAQANLTRYLAGRYRPVTRCHSELRARECVDPSNRPTRTPRTTQHGETTR